MKSKRSSHLGAGMAIGVVMGLAAGFFLQSKKGKQLSKDAQKKALQLQKQVMKKLDSVEDLTKEKYEEIVDEVVAYYGKTKDVAQKEIPEVRAYLLQRWKSIEEQLKASVDEIDE